MTEETQVDTDNATQAKCKCKCGSAIWAKWDSLVWIVLIFAIFGGCQIDRRYDSIERIACIEHPESPKCQ